MLGAVTMQLAQSLKTEGFTFIALHPGDRPDHATALAPGQQVVANRCYQAVRQPSL